MKLSKQHEIREAVMKVTRSKILRGFYSTYIQKQVNVDLKEVEHVLDVMVKEGILQKEYEFICHNDHCLRVLDRQKSMEEFEETYECEYCGEEMEEISSFFIKVRYLNNRHQSSQA